MFLRVWGTVEGWLVGLCGLAGLLLAVYQMISRYAFPDYFVDWAEESIVYLVVWGSWLASSGLVATDRHVRADLVIRLLPLRAQHWVELVNTLVGIVFCGVVAWIGIDIVTLSWDLDERSTSSLRMPMWIYFACVPVGTGLMTLRYVCRLWRLLAHRGDAPIDFGGTSHAH
ncbi:MAG: TRAP transporter small permease [Alphaproteobacteria bacterium]|nr:TRAP transporter small permease [Alphaproteobacteria bacterium]